MKRLRVIGGAGMTLLLVLTVAGIFLTRAWATPASVVQRVEHTASNVTPGTSSGPAVNLSLPSHHTAMPTATATPVPATTATPSATMPAAQPTSAPAPTPTAASTGGANSGGMNAQEASLAQQLLAQINQDRAANGGLAAYSLSDPLVASSYNHSVVMGSGCGLSHQCSGEADPCTRMTNQGASWNACGENAGYAGGYSDYWQAVLVIHQGMMNEKAPNDGHRQNLLSQSFHKIGIGIYISGDTVWLTEDFTN